MPVQTRWPPARNEHAIDSLLKKRIDRSFLFVFFMDSNFSLVAAFEMAGNNGRGRDNFSAICEGLKSTRSLCVFLRMSEKNYKAKRGQCTGTSSGTDIKLAV